MAGALGTKVIGLMRNTDYLSAHFTPDHDMSDPGSGNADVTFGTWRCDGREVRVVRKEIRRCHGMENQWVKDSLLNEALATGHVSHMEGFPELFAWDTDSAVLIIEDLGRVDLGKLFFDGDPHDKVSMDVAEVAFYKALCLINQLHAAGVYHFDLAWDNLVIGADSREQAKRNSSHHKISVIDLGQAKICPSLHGSDDHKSFRRPLNGSDWFDVNECQFWRENLKDPWVDLSFNLKEVGIGNGQVNGRYHDLCSLGNMMKELTTVDNMKHDLANLVHGLTAKRLTERFDAGASLHDHAFLKRMRATAIREGWIRVVPGSKPPSTLLEVPMPKTIPSERLNAFHEVAGFDDPLRLFKGLMASRVGMAKRTANQEEALAGGGAPPANGASIVMGNEDERDARDMLSDGNGKGKGKAGSSAQPQIISAAGGSTETLEGAAGAAGTPSPPVAAMAGPRTKPAQAVRSRTQPLRSCRTTVVGAVAGAAEVVGEKVVPLCPSRRAKNARGGQQAKIHRKRPRVHEEGASSLEGVAIGGGRAKRHRNVNVAVSWEKNGLSEVAAPRVVRHKRSAKNTSIMTLRSRAVRTMTTHERTQHDTAMSLRPRW